MTTIGSKLQQLRQRIAAACDVHGRPSGSVRLLAVSKTFDDQAVRDAAAAGQQAFGENYIQEGVEKILLLRDLPLEWHMIGPIQSNKTRAVAQHFDWVHTIDRVKIAQRLSEQRPPELPPLQVCLQVNIDGGVNKSGVPPEEALALALACAALPRLVVRGLMVIPEPADEPEAQLRPLLQARALFEQLRSRGEACLARMDTLSMGMTADLEAAIQAGSTLVRVGSAIFGVRPRAD